MRQSKTTAQPPMSKVTNETLLAMSEEYATDPCFGKPDKFDPQDYTCIQCSAMAHCGTIVGAINYGELIDSDKDGAKALDRQQYITKLSDFTKAQKTSIVFSDKFLDVMGRELVQAEEAGQPYSTSELLVSLTEADPTLTTLQRVVWLSDLYKKNNLVVMSNLIVKAL